MNNQNCTETNQQYGVWITNREGEPNGRWISDSDNGVSKWAGSYEEAESFAWQRRRLYAHVNYEVKPIE